MDQNGELVSVKKIMFLAFLIKILDPENLAFALENGKNGQMSEAREKVLKKHFTLDVANNRYVILFFPKKSKKEGKEEKSTSIEVKSGEKNATF